MVVVNLSSNGRYWEREGKVFSVNDDGNEHQIDEKTKEFIKNGKNFVSYYLDDKNKRNTDKKVIPALRRSDKDWIEVIDGNEGVGKSYYAFQRAKYIDPTFDLSRVVFTPEEFKEAIFKATIGQAIVYDEAFTGLSSRASLSPINKYLISLMMQMRQKNLFVVLVLPTFFLLDKYAALFRTKILTHVYETKSGLRGYYRIYNQPKKRMLFLAGKYTYSYSKDVFTRNKGRFYGVFALGDEEILKKYKIKKAKALESTEKTPMTAGQIKYREQRDVALWLLRRNNEFSYQELSNLLGEYDIEISYVQIRNICAKFGDKEKQKDKETRKEQEKTDENEDKSDETSL